MEINVNTGTREFNLGGKVSVFFNPTDASFLARMRDTFTEMQNKQEEITKRLSDADDIFEESVKIDEEMRGAINHIFGKDVVTPLIGDMNVYSLADGLPIWAQILTATMDTIQQCINEEREKSEKKIKEYTNKYSVEKASE